MNTFYQPRNILLGSAIFAALSAAFLSTHALSQQKLQCQNKVLGTWRMVSAQIDPDGKNQQSSRFHRRYALRRSID